MDKPIQSEQQQFLEDLEIKPADILDRPLEIPGEEPKEEEAQVEDEQKAKNRRERRLIEKNQQLREEAIAAQARLQGITEAQHTRETSEPAEYLKRAERIYGNATPEAIEATNLLKETLEAVRQAAKEDALKEFETQRTKESEAVAEEEKAIEEGLERLEDDHGVDFSDENTRKGFLTFLERLSPKDRDGNIIEYADFDATYELYEKSKEKSNAKAKELANRSMTRSGASGGSTIEVNATERYLRDHGIID